MSLICCRLDGMVRFGTSAIGILPDGLGSRLPRYYDLGGLCRARNGFVPESLALSSRCGACILKLHAAVILEVSLQMAVLAVHNTGQIQRMAKGTSRFRNKAWNTLLRVPSINVCDLTS